MNATSYCWSYIDFYTLITYISYVTYNYDSVTEQNLEAVAGGVFKILQI